VLCKKAKIFTLFFYHNSLWHYNCFCFFRISATTTRETRGKWVQEYLKTHEKKPQIWWQEKEIIP